MAGLEQRRQIVAGLAIKTGELDAREERRARRADVGVGRLQRMLRGAHIGPAHQQLRRQSGGQGLRKGLRIEGALAGGDLRGQRLTDQQRERIAILRHAARLLRDVDFGFAPRGLRAMQVDLARHARVEAQLGQVVGLALAVVRFPRQRAAAARSAISVSHALATSDTSTSCAAVRVSSRRK